MRNILVKNILPVEDIFLAMANAIRHFDEKREKKILKRTGVIVYENDVALEQLREQWTKLYRNESESMKHIKIESWSTIQDEKKQKHVKV